MASKVMMRYVLVYAISRTASIIAAPRRTHFTEGKANKIVG
jgi:hypothetical protein